MQELFRIKTSKKELLSQSSYFCAAWTFSEELHFGKSWFFRKAISRITYFFWRAAFSERLLFQKTLPSIAATFSEELLFYNVLFQKSYYFTTMVPFHSYTSYLFVNNEVISVLVRCSLNAGFLSCVSVIAQNCIIDGSTNVFARATFPEDTFFLEQLIFNC